MSPHSHPKQTKTHEPHVITCHTWCFISWVRWRPGLSSRPAQGPTSAERPDPRLDLGFYFWPMALARPFCWLHSWMWWAWSMVWLKARHDPTYSTHRAVDGPRSNLNPTAPEPIIQGLKCPMGPSARAWPRFRGQLLSIKFQWYRYIAKIPRSHGPSNKFFSPYFGNFQILGAVRSFIAWEQSLCAHGSPILLGWAPLVN